MLRNIHCVNLDSGRAGYLKGFGFYLFACAIKVQGITASRATRVHEGARGESTDSVWIKRAITVSMPKADRADSAG
jgi:hypothetical protein